MKARREIDELLKGRAEAEARVRVLNEENTAAAEALRRCTSSLLPDTDTKDTTPAEAGAGAASGSFDKRRCFKSNDLGLSRLSVRPGTFAESETKELKSLNLPSGDSAAGGTAGLVGLAGCPGPGLETAGEDHLLQSCGKRLLFLDVDGVLHPLKVRLMGQKVDTTHCFEPSCMEELCRVTKQSGADLVVTSSWRQFETARNVLAEHLSRYGLHIKDWTTTAGGESNEARVNQILSYVTALDVAAWAVVDDEVSCGGDSGGGEVFPADKQARNKLLQTSDEISRRMEELLSRRGKTLHALLECKGTGEAVQTAILEC
eukprot:symbB.v1.2.001570.t2/scaffold88.1/size340390/5